MSLHVLQDKSDLSNCVSVVIPAYNCANTIDRALLSLSVQSQYIKEVVIIDDASTDSIFEYVNTWISNGLPIKYYYHSVNRGPGSARNFGISKCTGKYIAFLDADDYWHSQKLEFQLKLFNKNENIQILGSLTQVSGDPNFFIEDKNYLIKKYNFYDFVISNPIPMRSVIMRRNTSIEFGSKNMVEDYYAWLNYLSKNRNQIHRIEIVLAFSGKLEYSKGSYSSKLWSSELKEINTLIKVFNTNLNALKFCIPLVIFYSLTKYLMREIKFFLRNE